MMCRFNIPQETRVKLLDTFMDRYVICVDKYDKKKLERLREYYTQILNDLSHYKETNETIEIYKTIATFKLKNHVPYLIMSNEVYGLKNMILEHITSKDATEKVLDLIQVFKDISDAIAQIYLADNLQKLKQINSIRLHALADLMDIEILQYYKAHIVWMDSLAHHIQNLETKNFPQLNEKLCDFGQWLYNSAREIIQDDTKVDSLHELHHLLHMFAKKIYYILYPDQEDKRIEYHALISYIEKCEYLSLSLGTELALLDNRKINILAHVDTLTKALSRTSLESIFKKQYELMLATSNSFTIAMCDLDDFKKVNDTYGHPVGDKVLQSFVVTAHSLLRNSDFIIRYGGEEFLIILSAVKRDRGIALLEKLCKTFAQTAIETPKDSIHATVSIGAVAIEPHKAWNLNIYNEYLSLADNELYRAKNDGKNRVKFF